MITLYHLVMADPEASYDDHVEEFGIGLFSTYEKAEETAKRYLTEVCGFRNDNVTYRITEKSVLGYGDDPVPEAFMIYGWNENDDLDEIDVIESDCYATIQEAERQLKAMQEGSSRKEWCINRIVIDECDWQEGFVRE